MANETHDAVKLLERDEMESAASVVYKSPLRIRRTPIILAADSTGSSNNK